MVQFLPLFGRNSCPCMEYYTIIYMLLVVAQMMLDAAFFQIIINVPLDSADTQINIYQCIIVPVHCLQATLQFFFGFDLYKATIRKSFRRARNWQMIFLCLLAIEASVFVAYMALAAVFSIFTYVTALAIVFKLYLIWPLRIFLEDCQDVCVPLAHAASNVYLDEETPQSRPGPSSSVNTRPIESR